MTGYEIAVIGMAGRFPGAGSIDEFWENLKNGKEGIRFFTDEELEEAGAAKELLTNPNFVRAKGMLEDVEYFDASFFNYTFREADIMDPQLRILHQCCWTALEDAGYNPDAYEGQIGFYGGASTHFYWLSRLLDRVQNPSEAFGVVSLNDGYSVSTQIAYRLNLKGPAVTLQTACSTSLVAIHAACQALLSGECDMALAGGVSVKLPIKSGYIYQEGMVLSPDGRCRAFDEKAAGCVEGSGVGIVVLKSLENALQDRDHIYAVVKGTAINNDGNRRVGFSAPSVIGQAEVIRMAQQAADVEPESISYLETHGTGTTLGDPVEIRALVRAFNTEKKKFCRIGSVKSNIGHLDAAAGVAGFIKTVLALYHRMIPPTLHFENPNPEIDFENSPFIVNTTLTEWKSDNNKYPLRAGVSSFGIGGTNAHVVVEAWSMERGAWGKEQWDYQLVVLSAKTESALERNTLNLVNYFKNNPNLPDAAYTLQVGRKAFEYRRTLVCRDAAEAVELLSAGNSKKVHTQQINAENPPVMFMFSGLGSQYVNMGRDLYEEEPVFREEMDRCFKILEPLIGYDIKEILYPDGLNRSYRTNINQTEITQPVIFAIEYALAKLLMKWGIIPYAMIGYSFGEYAAACTAGVLSLEDALTLIVHRGELISKTPEGAMLSVPLPKEELDCPSSLSLAIDNGPSCIVAGSKADVDAFEKQLKQDKYLCMRLNTTQAIHSGLMNPILQEFEAKLKGISLKEPRIPYISNLTGTWITGSETTDPSYWTRHLAGTVRFAEGIEELVRVQNAIFLELGPGRDLTTLVQRSLGEHQRALNLMRPGEKETPDTAYLLDRLGRLWLCGREIDWNGFYDGKAGERRRLSLPTYSFERQRFVLDGGGEVQPQKEQAVDVSYNRIHLPEDYEAPRDEVESKIAEAFQSIFALDQIGIHDDFFELGGDSLKVITLVTRLHQQLNVEIPMDAVFKYPTVEKIAQYIGREAGESIFSFIPPVEKKEYYPLSPAQKRVFILEQIEEKGNAYNMPSVIWLEGTLDTTRLDQACRGLLERHESLRSGFSIKDGEPIQRIYPSEEIEFEVEYHDVNPGNIQELVDSFIHPFDLSCPPLWRVGMVKVSAEKYLLMDCIHHIVSDDISIGVLITEFSALYCGESLEELPVQYKDYAVWQQEVAAEDSRLQEQKAYWLDRFSDAGSGNLPLLEIPCDFPRPELQSFEGAHIEFVIPKERVGQMVELARKNRTTLFVLLFTLYNTLLYKYTGQEDIIVGTPITGRSHRDVQQVVGMFVNTLTLRNFPKGDRTFEEFLEDVKQSTLEAFSNQFYQFEDLVEQLDIPRDMSRNPLFDTMFVLHTVNLENVKIPGMRRMYPYEFEHSVSRFDMTLNVAEFSGGLNCVLEYNTALFEEETMQRFKNHFMAVVDAVVQHPGRKLADLQLLGEEERKQVLYDFNATGTDYPKDKTLHQLFEDQVDKTPDHISLIGLSQNRVYYLAYRELSYRANQWASRLRNTGIRTGSIVGLMTDRTIEMIVGLMAILKSGAAYLPIDPMYPPDRIRYMVDRTGAPILLATGEIPFDYPSTSQVMDLTKEIDEVDGNLPALGGPADLAYVIYTSGTTGVPKGVMIEHRSVINFIKGIIDHIPFTVDDRILSLTTLSFDIFVLETLLPLTVGSTVVVGSIEEQTDVLAASVVIKREKVTILQVTPSRLKLFVSDRGAAEGLGRLDYLLVGGEAFPVPLLEEAGDFVRGKIYNLYGPTETTVWSCIKDVTEGVLNIGKPLANTQIYILNKTGHLQPVGVPGELCIGGDGLARGYLNDLMLTKQKFLEVQKPFFKKVFGRRRHPLAGGPYKIYRTGDLARWLADGNIEFLGRMDQQVKVRGFRIEPAEIENHLLKHEDIKETVVLAQDDDRGDKYLSAYIVSDREPSVSQLREFLAGDLPDYMIPSQFIRIEQIPVTPNGKIDRKTLAGAEGTRLKSGSAYVAPESDIEKTIAGLWKEKLNLDQVGVDDNFFDLGGTSMKVIMLVSELKEILKKDIPVVTMFRYPTIRLIAAYLNQEQAAPRRRDRSDIKAKGRERLRQKRSLRQ